MLDVNQTHGQARLSFVMPYTLRETFCYLSSWRDAVNEDGNARFVLFLRSFLHLFEQDDLCEFFVVCPAAQCAAVRGLVAAITDDSRYVVVAEDVVAPGIDAILRANAEGRGGWYAQQVVKLAAYRIVGTRHYVVLDSDLVCIRSCNYGSFIKNGRPLLSVETARDYARLYSRDFVAKEIDLKTARCRRSLLLIDRNPQSVDQARFYGETPVILSAPHVASMLGELEHVHNRAWVAVLAESYGWTEYGLYFGHLDALALTGTIYRPGNCNAVLSLDKSVWQETIYYRSARDYDYAHFFDSQDGYFVAVQSWLAKAAWLPTRYATRLEFYQDMEDWIKKRYPRPLS